MNNNLPKVFSKKTFLKDNNIPLYYSKNKTVNLEKSKTEIDTLLNGIFSSPNFVYKMKVKVYHNNIEETLNIISRNNTHIYTLENKTIKISDIKDIKIL